MLHVFVAFKISLLMAIFITCFYSVLYWLINIWLRYLICGRLLMFRSAKICKICIFEK